MSEDIIKAQDVFLGNINRLCSKFGLNNIMAQIYALLYLSGKPLSLNDMVERLKISKGSASVNIRELERYGAVRHIWVKGSRKDYYEAESDIKQVILERAKSMIGKRLGELEDLINSSSVMLSTFNIEEDEGKQSEKIFKDRLQNLRSLHEQACALFNLFNATFSSGDFMKTHAGKGESYNGAAVVENSPER
jgi:DNA-binding transcriptional regulator GbsR (MarR family)